MISCLGLVVGALESANRFSVVNQLCKWLHNNKHLLAPSGTVFEIDGVPYVTMYPLDTADDGAVLVKAYFPDDVMGIMQVVA